MLSNSISTPLELRTVFCWKLDSEESLWPDDLVQERDIWWFSRHQGEPKLKFDQWTLQIWPRNWTSMSVQGGTAQNPMLDLHDVRDCWYFQKLYAQGCSVKVDVRNRDHIRKRYDYILSNSFAALLQKFEEISSLKILYWSFDFVNGFLLLSFWNIKCSVFIKATPLFSSKQHFRKLVQFRWFSAISMLPCLEESASSPTSNPCNLK